MGAGVDIVFYKPAAGRRYRSRLRRADGVVVELEGGSWNQVGGSARELPHDLAHCVVEDGLGLERGLWGVIAAGGGFDQVTVVEGRRPPHAERRARAITDAAGETLRQAEVLVGAVCDAALAGGSPDPAALQRAVGPRWWSPTIDAAALAQTIAALHDAAAAWAALAPGAALAWPAPAAAVRSSGRRRR
jgi:hypothetical protein